MGVSLFDVSWMLFMVGWFAGAVYYRIIRDDILGFVRWHTQSLIGYAIYELCFAVQAVWKGQYFQAIFCGAFAAWFAYRWWNDDENRRRRRKLADRARGVVRDMGGRLKVVRPAASR